MEADLNAEVYLKLGKTEIDWKVCIARIRDNVLIGMDFLKQVDGIIMTRQGDLLIKDELIPGRYSKETDYHVCRVTVANETILEPMAETNVVRKVDCPKESVIGVLDPASLKNGTHTGSVLVPMKEKIPVRIINPTHQRVKLPTGTHLGKLVEVMECDRDEPDTITEGNVEPDMESPNITDSLPEYLKSVVESTGDNLTSHQKQEVGRLLVEFKYIFARNDEDLGCFSGIQHYIKTGDAKPTRQPPKRTPL